MTADWSFQNLESLIQSRGDLVIVETGVSCTCRNSDSWASFIKWEGTEGSTRKINCTKCQGGWFFRDPRVIKGLITSVKPGDVSLIDAGFAIPGDAIFSTSLHAFPIGPGDRVTFTVPSFVGEGLVIMRGAHNKDQNAGLNKDLEPNEDQLYYQAASAVWCEDENGVVYEEGADFILDSFKIRWVGKRPTETVLFSLKYCAYLEWIVYDFPSQRFDRARDLSQKVILRKKHVAFNTGSKAKTPEQRDEEFHVNKVI